MPTNPIMFRGVEGEFLPGVDNCYDMLNYLMAYCQTQIYKTKKLYHTDCYLTLRKAILLKNSIKNKSDS